MSFSDRLVELLNGQAVATALGVASRCGLLNALSPEPQSLQSLCKKAEVDVRYAQEMLAVLVCGKVVDFTEQEALYTLPEDRQKALASMGLYFEELPLLSRCAFTEVSQAARVGGGINANYSEFSSWMGRIADSSHEQRLVTKFFPALGEAMLQKLKSGIRVCDVGCGSGTVPLLMAQAFPQSSLLGLDTDRAALNAAKSKAEGQGLSNVQFTFADASSVDSSLESWFGQCELVTAFDVIHDLPKPREALLEIKKLLKPHTGIFAMVDIRAHSSLAQNMQHSMAPFLYAVSLLHCMPQGLHNGGLGLGMMWGREKALEMLNDVGFEVEILEMDFDTFNDCYMCRVKADTAT